MKVILAEKPSVAKEIAKILGANNNMSTHMEGNGYQVTWAFGHLITLADANTYLPGRTTTDKDGNVVEDKSWHIEDLPIIPDHFIYEITQETSARKQFHAIKKLFREADDIVCATDAGREGEAIFRYIHTATGCGKSFKRLWISSLTETAIRNGLNQLHQGNEFDSLYHSAKARNEADWLVGINASRALCLTSKQRLSIGRVQTPTLAIICQRFLENKHFTPEPYYTLDITLNQQMPFKATYPKNFKTQEEAQSILDKIREKVFLSDKEQKEVTEKPPLPFSLTALQEEANRRFQFSAQKTLDLIQAMYEKKYLTYPRTDSRYLATDMMPDIEKNISLLAQLTVSDSFGKAVQFLETKGIEKFCFDNNKLTDHHAIIPTFENLDNINKLSQDEKKLFLLISKQLVMALLPVCKKQKLTYRFIFDPEDEKLSATGSTIKEAGWRMLFEKNQEEENEEEENQSLPDLKKDSHCDVVSKGVKEKMTQRPPLLTEASLLKLMETAGKLTTDEIARQALKECGIGTPATRANIIETLIKREMVAREKNKLIPTNTGLQVYGITKEMLISQPQLTGEWEHKLNKMADGKYPFDKFQEEIIEETKYLTKAIMELGASVQKMNQTNIANKHVCPICGAPLKENSKAIGCSKFSTEGEGCKFVVWKEICGKKLSESQLTEMVTQMRTAKPVSGMTSKAGKKFDATLTYNKESQRIEFEFEDHIVGKCPKCGKEVKENSKAYSCSDKECQFVVWKEFTGHKFKVSEVAELLTKKELKNLKFKSKEGKEFTADIAFDENYKLTMQFKNK